MVEQLVKALAVSGDEMDELWMDPALNWDEMEEIGKALAVSGDEMDKLWMDPALNWDEMEEIGKALALKCDEMRQIGKWCETALLVVMMVQRLGLDVAEGEQDQESMVQQLPSCWETSPNDQSKDQSDWTV